MWTASSDGRFIQSLWRAGDCLVVDSVQFGDGRIALLDVVYPPGWYGAPRVTPSVCVRSCTGAADCRSNLGDDDQATANLFPAASCECEYGGQPMTAVGGECGGHGSFGYVAVFDLDSDTLAWMAFFLKSNPFVKIEHRAGILHAVTNLGVAYAFRLDDPTAITITAPPDAGG